MVESRSSIYWGLTVCQRIVTNVVGRCVKEDENECRPSGGIILVVVIRGVNSITIRLCQKSDNAGSSGRI